MALSGLHYEQSNEVYVDFESSANSCNQYFVEPLLEMGHSIDIYIESRMSHKTLNLLQAYSVPIVYAKFANPNCDVHQIQKLINVLKEINSLNSTYDLVFRMRFDMKFFQNPFKIYNWNFDKINFLARTPDQFDIPMINDTFFCFPYRYTHSIIQAISHATAGEVPGGLHSLYYLLVRHSYATEDDIVVLSETPLQVDHNVLYKLDRRKLI